jgi:hypothetical protein
MVDNKSTQVGDIYHIPADRVLRDHEIAKFAPLTNPNPKVAVKVDRIIPKSSEVPELANVPDLATIQTVAGLGLPDDIKNGTEHYIKS